MHLQTLFLEHMRAQTEWCVLTWIEETHLLSKSDTLWDNRLENGGENAKLIFQKYSVKNRDYSASSG